MTETQPKTPLTTAQRVALEERGGAATPKTNRLGDDKSDLPINKGFDERRIMLEDAAIAKFQRKNRRARNVRY